MLGPKAQGRQVPVRVAVRTVDCGALALVLIATPVRATVWAARKPLSLASAFPYHSVRRNRMTSSLKPVLRAPPAIAGGGLALLVLAGWAVPAAHAEPGPEPESEPKARGGALLADFQGSAGGPFGRWSLALGYDHRGEIALGVGVGINQEWSQRHSLPPLGLFGRWLPWRGGVFSLGFGGSVARQFQSTTEGLPGVESLTTSFNPGYRADGVAVAQLADHWWSFRLEAGVGYFFTKPTCTFDGSTYVVGDCDSPSIPSQSRHTIATGQIVPTMTASLGLRLGGGESRAGTPPYDLTPADWAHALMLGDAMGLGATLITALPLAYLVGGANNSNAFGGVAFAGALLLGGLAGTSFGVASGVFLVGRGTARPDGTFRRALLGSLVGSLLATSATALVYWGSKGSARRQEYSVFTGLVLFATLPAGFGAGMYRGSASAPPPPGLLQFDGEDGHVTTGIPSVGLSNDGGIPTVRVAMIGGRF